MNRKAAIHCLEAWEEESLLKEFRQLSLEAQESVAHDLLQIHPETLFKQRALLSSSAVTTAFYAPYTTPTSSGHQESYLLGRELLSQGKCAAVLIAGGQGTRLSFRGPKGCCPVSVIKQKSLFQLFAEKTAAASRQVGRDLALGIMTSSLNHTEISTFFVQHNFFGLKPQQLHFFVQKNLPYLDLQGHLFLEEGGHLAQGPCGNGAFFEAFHLSGVSARWQESGIAYVNFVHVDNPLLDPFDAELFGFHAQNQLDISIKAIQRSDAEEQVGVLASHQGTPRVLEYHELSSLVREQMDLYPLANISAFTFSMAALESFSNLTFPLHAVQRSSPRWDPRSGELVRYTELNAWKFEYFIFDALHFTKSADTLVYPREVCFAPLKNREGRGSLISVKSALQEADQRVFAALSGLSSQVLQACLPFELSQEFYYPTEELTQLWRGKIPPKDLSYIRAEDQALGIKEV